MSADEWTTCPACLKAGKNKRKKWNEKLKKAYGKVSPEKYIELKNRAESDCDSRNESLAEYYEIGVNEDGYFYVDFSGHCDSCGYSFTYKHNENTLRKKS